VPGGPCKRTPRAAPAPRLSNISGYVNGKRVISFSVLTCSSIPAREDEDDESDDEDDEDMEV